MTLRNNLLLCLLMANTALAATPKASSELVDDEGKKFSAVNAFDGDLSTSWSEAEAGDGHGSTLVLPLDVPTKVSSVSIWPGFLAGRERTIREYARPKTITITLSGKGDPVTTQFVLPDVGKEGSLRKDIPIEMDGVREVELRIDDTYGGGIFAETHVAEFAVNFLSGELPKGVEKAALWLASEEAQKKAAEHAEEIATTTQAISEAEFGDRDRLANLMSWAANGAPFLRESAEKVPYGFRMQVIVPDLKAIEALLTIKDPNAIAALKRAAIRTKGQLQQELNRRAEMLAAHQDMLGARNRNVAAWGARGLAKGALSCMGEPLNVVIDSFAGIYVADVGNNRVQRFGLKTGVVEEVWGAEEGGMSDVFVTQKHAPYGSGSAAGTDNGQFTNPLDVAVVYDKKAGDSIWVLDASGRLQVINAKGTVVDVFDVDTKGELVPGYGGDAHLVVNKKNVFVIWSNRGVVFERKNMTQIGDFDIKDGAPRGAVGLPGNQVGLVFKDKLVRYSFDGFRHGDVMHGALGKGFSRWAPTLDERGKMWAITDDGRVVKFKKPGVVDFEVQAVDHSLDTPRLAVLDSMVVISSTEDKLIKVDALELLAEKEEK